MPLPRRRGRDDELPELPPLEGDDATLDLDVGGDPPLDEGPVSLDDAAADELTLAEIAEPTATGDDGEEAVDTGDDAEGLSDDGERWGDDPEAARGEADDIDALDELPPDDGGAEGLDGDRADELGELPPIDDDAGDDAPLEGDALPLAAAFALPAADGLEARVLVAGGAAGVAVGVDHVFVAGDRLRAWPTALLDDPEAPAIVLEAPAGASLCAVSEDVSRTLTVADHDGTLWRRERARDPWLALRWTDDERAGRLALWAHGATLWALSPRGSLRREVGGHFTATLADERVRALALDARGAVAVAVTGLRRDGVRARDESSAWTTLSLPSPLDADAVARAGEVIAVAGSAGGFVTADGGARWSSWPLLAGATALCAGETDDGAASVFAAVTADDRALVIVARVAGDGAAAGAARLCDLSALLPPGGDDDPPQRIERLVPVDRAGRRLLAVTATGAVVLLRRPA